jgi:hypothetical protein
MMAVGTSSVAPPTTIPPHRHHATEIVAEPEAVTALLSGDDVQEDLEELGVEKLARSGEQPMLGSLDMNHFDVSNVRDAEVESDLTMTGPVGEAIITGARVVHMAGDHVDDEAKVDGLERVVFNNEPTASTIETPSVVQFNPAVAAGGDTTHQEGQVGWDAAERTLVADAEPAAYNAGTETPRFSMGWAVVNCLNGSGAAIPPVSLVYVSGGLVDATPTPDIFRPAVTMWDGSADSFGAQLGASQRVTGVTMNGSDNGEPVQVMRRGLLRGIPSDNAEGWVIGDRIWADRSVPGGLTKVVETSGEYPRIFIGTIFDDTGTEGPWAIDVDVRVLPTPGEMSYVALVALLDYFVPVWNSTAGWVPGLLPAVGVAFDDSVAVLGLSDVQAVLDVLADRQIQRGGSFLSPSGALAVVAWRAPYACTVLNVRGYRSGGTGAMVNARKNGASTHLASDLSLTSDVTWMDGGAVQNATYAAGDSLELLLQSVAGSPAQVVIQVDFRRT